MLSGAGAFVAGPISTGVGEATLPPLVRRSRFPVPVAAATSTVIAWAMPGAVLGAVAGTRLQGRFSERATRWFFTVLFAAVGVTFLAAFTVFRHRFG